jgi:hypothetical protein
MHTHSLSHTRTHSLSLSAPPLLPNMSHQGIAGYLIKDLLIDRSGSEVTASFAELEGEASAHDHRDTPHAYVTPAGQLRCDGNGVTHTSTAQNKTVKNVASIR